MFLGHSERGPERDLGDREVIEEGEGDPPSPSAPAGNLYRNAEYLALEAYNWHSIIYLESGLESKAIHHESPVLMMCKIHS